MLKNNRIWVDFLDIGYFDNISIVRILSVNTILVENDISSCFTSMKICRQHKKMNPRISDSSLLHTLITVIERLSNVKKNMQFI